MSATHRSTFGIAALVCLLSWSAPQASAPAEYTLLPDTGGLISSVAVSVNSARRASLRNAKLATRIVNGLRADVRFSILTNDPGAFSVAKTPWPARIKFLELPADNPITIWPQDPFLVLTSRTGATKLLMPRQFDRVGDRVMAAEIAAAHGFEISASRLYFEGGDIVSDESFVFVGASTIRHNAERWPLSEAGIAELFEGELGRRVLVVGTHPQPIGHIDMVLTPLGDRRVALADSGAGASIAKQALSSDAAAVLAFETAAEENFFGSPGVKSLTLVDGRKITAPELKHQTAAMIEASRRLAPALEGIAGALEGFGYEVVRVPFLFGGPASRERGAGAAGSKAAYPMLSYNNVLIEEAEGARVVYLPRYGLTALDDAAESAWTGLGFTVRAIGGLTTSAMYGGALRCSVKVLAR